VKILLTGASGFLGSALALNWLEAGHKVALLLRDSSQLHRLKGLEDEFQIIFSTNDAEINAFINNFQPDVVTHTACIYGRRNETNLQIFEANQRFGLVIIESLRALSKNTYFINTGSALESHVSLYALSKNQFSEWGRALAREPDRKIKFINVLLQHMYGPNDDESKFTTFVIRECQRNKPELKLTAGEQLRDFIYIEDVVKAYDILLAHESDFDSYEDIEIGSGVPLSIRNFVETVHKITKSSTQLLFGAIPYRNHEAMNSVANIKKMKNLGWTPKFDLKLGLLETIAMESIK